MSTMPFPQLLFEAGLKIQWALFQREHLASGLRQYAKEGVRLEPVSQSEHEVRLRFAAASIPFPLPMMLGTAIHSLRSSLDTAISRLYHEATGEYHDRINFPTHRTQRELVSTFDKGNNRLIRDVLPEVAELIMTKFQPWQDGNYKLWALTKLDNDQKHKVAPILVGSTGWVINRIAKGTASMANSLVILSPGEETSIQLGGAGELEIDADAQVGFSCPLLEKYFPDIPIETVLHDLTEVAIGIVHDLEECYKGRQLRPLA